MIICLPQCSQATEKPGKEDGHVHMENVRMGFYFICPRWSNVPQRIRRELELSHLVGQMNPASLPVLYVLSYKGATCVLFWELPKVLSLRFKQKCYHL